MNQQEKQQLNEIIEEVDAMREFAPATAVYVKGRTQPTMAVRLLDLLGKLRALVGEDVQEETVKS